MLQKLENAYSILDTIPVGIFWKDKNSVYIGCNAFHASCAGVSREEIVGKRDCDLCWSSSAEDCVQGDQQVMTSGESEEVTEMRLLHNREVWARITKTPLIVNGEIVGVLGIWQDVTEIKDILDNLLDALRQAREKSQHIEAICDSALWKCVHIAI